MNFTTQWRSVLASLTVFSVLALAALACAGNAVNMAILGVPRYTCPSATPRATDILPPPAPPRYLAGFQATLDYSYTDPTRTLIRVQYLAQNVGTVQISYSGVLTDGTLWNGASVVVAYTGNFLGVQAAYPVVFPAALRSGQITISSASGSLTFPVVGFNTTMPGSPAAPPCCLPGAIYPTPVPTYTPYPTPTLFQMSAPTSFFLEDPIYNDQPPVQLRLRMKSPIREGLFQFVIPLFSAASWTIQITNVGRTEYDFLGAGYTFVTEVSRAGVLQQGVWPPSHYAAQFLGIVEQAYGPQAVQPGQTITITVAAWIPANSHVTKISLVLDPFHSGDPGWATFTPGSRQERNQISWTNALNTICRGEIQYP